MIVALSSQWRSVSILYVKYSKNYRQSSLNKWCSTSALTTSIRTKTSHVLQNQWSTMLGNIILPCSAKNLEERLTNMMNKRQKKARKAKRRQVGEFQEWNILSMMALFPSRWIAFLLMKTSSRWKRSWRKRKKTGIGVTPSTTKSRMKTKSKVRMKNR